MWQQLTLLLISKAISEDFCHLFGIAEVCFPPCFQRSFHHINSVLSEKADHDPWMKFIWIRHGRGRMEMCAFFFFFPSLWWSQSYWKKNFFWPSCLLLGSTSFRKLLGWSGIGEISYSKHKLQINLSMCLLVMLEGPSFFSQQSWLLFTILYFSRKEDEFLLPILLSANCDC